MTKPRLYLHMGIWHCASMRMECLRMGLGYDAKSAYADWLALK